MTAPIRSMPELVALTAVTSYTELIAGIRAQLGALGIRYEDFDDLAGFAAGLSGKVFGPAQVKRLGPEKMFDAMRAAGLRIRLEADPEQLAKMQARIADNFNPRQANQARMNNHSSPVSIAVLSRAFRQISKQGGKKRWQRKSKKDRSDHMTMMINARWKKERKRKRALKARRAGAAHRAANAAKTTNETTA